MTKILLCDLNFVKDFFNQWGTSIQAITVVILVGITTWYARTTKTMSRIMLNEYKLKTRPYLSIERAVDRYFNNLQNTIQLGFHFINLGNVSVKYYVEELMLSGVNINPQRIDTILLPKQEGIIRTGIISFNSQTNINGDGLNGHIRIIFWPDGLNNERYYYTRHFSLAPNTLTNIVSEDSNKL